MNLSQRFTRYLIGVMIGLGLVFVFFGQRSCTDWMPNDRVLFRLSETEMIITKKARCELNCQGMDTEDLLHLLRTGNVDFSESETRSTPIIYRVDAVHADKGEYRMSFEARDSTSTLIEVKLDGAGECGCE